MFLCIHVDFSLMVRTCYMMMARIFKSVFVEEHIRSGDDPVVMAVCTVLSKKSLFHTGVI